VVLSILVGGFHGFCRTALLARSDNSKAGARLDAAQNLFIYLIILNKNELPVRRIIDSDARAENPAGPVCRPAILTGH
jgi:hypothetical protein